MFVDPDEAASGTAAAIGEPARARMLYCLMDDRARASTELAVVAGVSPSTASAHLNRLLAARLVRVQVQGKHRYYTLAGPPVARVLEGLNVLAGAPHGRFVPNTPSRLRAARTCYDHLAGTLGVTLRDRLETSGCLSANSGSYDLTPKGIRHLAGLGIDLEETRRTRRRFAYDCLDWSERRPHLGGALGAALLKAALRRKWVTQDLDSRALQITAAGRHDLRRHFGVQI
ncbi:MAG TPA: helix-turn-helix transcriptional regulator [Bryobacteraceae bacterium]|jgi:DNA-binding transcriptional ArsR family regulator|nr:helix-turn-helix transcriptional regulator [Bryobacteraceae bacterium]